MTKRTIKKVDSPDYSKQTVDVEFTNGDVEEFTAHLNPSNAYYILVDGERVYFTDLKNGDWLEQMLY